MIETLPSQIGRFDKQLASVNIEHSPTMLKIRNLLLLEVLITRTFAYHVKNTKSLASGSPYHKNIRLPC